MKEDTRKEKETETDYQPPNHLEGGLLVARGPRTTVRVLRSSSSSSSSVITSTAVVLGLEAVEGEVTASGLGWAARRVLAGGGTVTVWVWTTVLVSVSYAVSETTSGGSS